MCIRDRSRSGHSIANRPLEHRSTFCTTDILSVESSSRNSRIRRYRRATPNARSGSKPASPSVDGQDVRRTKKRRAISIWPLDSQSPARTSINRMYDGHLVRRELVEELSIPPPPASNTPQGRKVAGTVPVFVSLFQGLPVLRAFLPRAERCRTASRFIASRRRAAKGRQPSVSAQAGSGLATRRGTRHAWLDYGSANLRQ